MLSQRTTNKLEDILTKLWHPAFIFILKRHMLLLLLINVCVLNELSMSTINDRAERNVNMSPCNAHNLCSSTDRTSLFLFYIRRHYGVNKTKATAKKKGEQALKHAHVLVAFQENKLWKCTLAFCEYYWRSNLFSVDSRLALSWEIF